MTEQVASVAYLDSNVFIEAIEGPDDVSVPIRQLVEKAHGGSLVTSELTLAEVLAPSGNQPRRPDFKRLYLDLIVWSGLVDLKPVSREILLETTKLRELARLKLPDAIHLATAIRSGCRFFVSRDQNFSKMPEGMEKVAPDAAQMERLAGVFS